MDLDLVFLHQACVNDSCETAARLLNRVGYQAFRDGTTPLWVAIRYGAWNLVTFLLFTYEYKDSIVIETINATHWQTGQNALYIAAKHGPCVLLQKLLALGARYAPDNNESTALCAAATTNNYECLDFLLNSEHDERENVLASINSAHKASKMTALFLAAKNGHTRIVQALLAANANPNLACSTGETALMTAAAHGHHEVLAVLLAHSRNNINAADKQGKTALFWAAEQGQSYCVGQLLEAGAQYTPCNNSQTPLLAAVLNNHYDTLCVLLDEQNPRKPEVLASINHHDDERHTALYFAVIKNNPRMVKLLLESGATDLANNGQRTALMFAAERGYTEIVSELLQAEIIREKMNAQSKNPGETALFLAVNHNHLDVASLLLLAGAITSSDQKSKTLLMLAIDNNSAEMLKLLLESKINPNQKINDQLPLEYAVRKGSYEIAAWLLAYGSDVDAAVSELLMASKPDHKTGITRAIENIQALTRNEKKLLRNLLLRIGADTGTEQDNALSKAFFTPRGAGLFAKKTSLGACMNTLQRLFNSGLHSAAP